MINRIKKLLAGELDTPVGTHTGDELKLAAAALLVEAARMDENYDLNERRAIAAAVRKRFDLDELETATLVAEAERVQENATQLIRFTKTIKDQFSPEERIELIEILWEVVYADGSLHDYEANLMRRIGGLLYVPDQDCGAARRRVLARLGINP